jgi:hypothetical protein
MAVFATHVVLMRDFQGVAFAPGDELPEWAEDLVGAHCLEPETESASDSVDDEEESDTDPDPESEPEGDESEASGEEATAPAGDAPDFTAPAPRRNSRSRK